MEVFTNAYAVMISLWQAGWYSTGISQFEYAMASIGWLNGRGK